MYRLTTNIRGGYDKQYYCTPIYRSWFNMKTRCLNKKNSSYPSYGGRGIDICEKWLSFKGFLEDMGDSYEGGLTLDRIDNNRGYCKENCRWANKVQQARNTRNVERAKKYWVNDERLTIREIAEIFGIKRTTLDMRLNTYGWSLYNAVTK